MVKFLNNHLYELVCVATSSKRRESTVFVQQSTEHSSKLVYMLHVSLKSNTNLKWRPTIHFCDNKTLEKELWSEAAQTSVTLPHPISRNRFLLTLHPTNSVSFLHLRERRNTMTIVFNKKQIHTWKTPSSFVPNVGTWAGIITCRLHAGSRFTDSGRFKHEREKKVWTFVLCHFRVLLTCSAQTPGRGGRFVPFTQT